MNRRLDRSIDFAFELEQRVVLLSNIVPLRIVSERIKSSQKYKQIRSSIEYSGLAEPPVVARDKTAPDKFILLDGHMRLAVLEDMNVATVTCLVATDDEAYTYNKRINRLATVQEHQMILKAIERGVPEEIIAKVLNVNVQNIRSKRRLLNGICSEVVELLKDKHVPLNTFGELRKMQPIRQIEAAQLMVAMNKYSLSYAKSLLGATPSSQLVDAAKPKKVSGLSSEQIALMERESANLDREFQLLEETYGEDHLDLVIALGYVKKLIENARVVRFLAQHYPELLAEFQAVADASREHT
jgi:hypothetical protein